MTAQTQTTKHTPGPWYFGPELPPDTPCYRYRISNQRRQWCPEIVNEDGTRGAYDCVNIADYEAIAMTFDGTAEHPARANAALIAAAPNMLEALGECVSEPGAKCWDDPEIAYRRLRAINDIARAAIARAESRADA